MSSFLFKKDWKSWGSIVGLTLVLLLFGVFDFQQLMPWWLFAVILFATNWLSLTIISIVGSSLKWNQNLLLSSLRHVFYTILSSILTFFITQIESDYLVPYFSGFVIISVVFSSFDYLLSAIDELKALNQYIPVDKVIPIQSAIFKLENSKGRTAFEVPASAIICFEANDNYLTIYYLNNEQLDKSLERLSMSKAEEIINLVSNDFIRIHKSFLINQKHIKEILGKSQNYSIKLQHLDFPVPVSRRFEIQNLRDQK